MTGSSGPETGDQAVEYFATTDASGTITATRYNPDNLQLFNVVQTSDGAATASLTNSGFKLVLGAFGAMASLDADGHPEIVPVNDVMALVVNGGSESEAFAINADVNVTINAGAGDDQISVQAPHATIYGGDGNDTITGAGEADRIEGGNGSDVLSGGGGDDTVLGQAGANYIDGGDGNDSLTAYDWNDTIYGGAGNDTITGGKGADLLYGDDGDDLFYTIDDESDTIFGGNGNDIAYVTPDDQTQDVEEVINLG